MKRKIIEALMIVHMMVLLAACGKLDEENLLSTPAAESETTASSESQKDAPTKTPEQVSKGEVNDPYQEDGIGFRFVTQR